MDSSKNGQIIRRPSSALVKVIEPIETLVTPVADIYETADAFVIKLDMAGASKESIRVTIRPGRLSAHAPAGPPSPGHGSLLLSEIGRRSYFREFILGEGVRDDAIEAQFRDGVLMIAVPKTDEMKTRTIYVR